MFLNNTARGKSIIKQACHELLIVDSDHHVWAMKDFPISTFSQRPLILNFGLPNQFYSVFLFSSVNNNIVGANIFTLSSFIGGYIGGTFS